MSEKVRSQAHPLRSTLSKMFAAPSNRAFVHWWIIVGSTPYSAASSDTVRSPFTASSATRALKPASWFRRFFVLISSFLETSRRQIVASVTARFSGRSSVEHRARGVDFTLPRGHTAFSTCGHGSVREEPFGIPGIPAPGSGRGRQTGGLRSAGYSAWRRLRVRASSTGSAR